ncbi:hypothetical protein C8R46DRAFT_1230002 [Mycena filopes]|nr:hypothetical protein C8R46DRAFT_1230002 [Mycena filopes]
MSLMASSGADIPASLTRKHNSWGQDDNFYENLFLDTALLLLRHPCMYGDDDDVRLTGERKKTVCYSVSPSPLKKTGTAIKHVSQNLRRTSVRVVSMSTNNGGALAPIDCQTIHRSRSTFRTCPSHCRCGGGHSAHLNAASP